MYLFKYVSKSGICSRRKSSELIKSGQIKVNGNIIKDLYYEVLDKDVVEYKNSVLQLPKLIYILLNKPKDYLCTLADPRGRRNVLDLIEDKTLNAFGRIYPIGRLDRMTTGLIILTNDGDLTQKLAHPKYQIPKGYRVLLDKVFTKKDFEKLKQGLKLKDGFISIDKLHYASGKKKSNVEVFIHSGRNRIVRRIFEHLGYKVKKLDRFNYAGLTKKGLTVGKWRRLTKKEINYLKNL
ncbi:pseudouridine synthase [Candidatus Dependentiae bacterium]|nr:pseudouridine synthase [Candidatus Dependentiae bacterium]